MIENGHYTEENKYLQQHVIPCYAADMAFALKPAAFCDYAQEAAYLAATELGFGYEALKDHHTAWVLSRMSVNFYSYPKWRDEVELYTWHKGLDGLFFLRDYQMKDMEGNLLIDGTSSWLVINTETRRLVRNDDVLKIVPASTMCQDEAIKERAPKVVMPKDIEKTHVKDHLVVYSDCDFIGHTNNVRYIVWSMDSIPNEVTFNRPVRHIDINFNKETTVGEIVSIERACIEEGDTLKYLVEGCVDGKQAFICEITF